MILETMESSKKVNFQVGQSEWLKNTLEVHVAK